MPDDPTTPPLPPFLGGRAYIPAIDWEGRRYWRRDLTAEPKLHRLLAHVWAGDDENFLSIDALHLLDELVGGPPCWLSTTEPEAPPEDWQHAASVEGPRGLVQLFHKGEEASRAALARLVNSATVFVTRPLSAGPKLDDEETEEDLDDVGSMVVETDPVEACLDMVSEAIEELVHPGAQPALIMGEQSGVLKIGDAELSCAKANGVPLLRSLLYVAEAIVSTKGEAPSTEFAPGTTLFDWGLANATAAPPSLAAALEDPAWLNEQPTAPGLAGHWDNVARSMGTSESRIREIAEERGRPLRPAQEKPEPTILSLDEVPPAWSFTYNRQPDGRITQTIHAPPGASGAEVAAALGFKVQTVPPMNAPAVKATDVPTVILPEMPPILVRWLVVDEDGECVCYVLAASEDDAMRRAEEHGSEPADRLSPDPYMLDDWEEDKPLLQDEGAWIHARRRHLTWKLLDAVKRRKASCAQDGDTGIWCWTGVDGLMNPNDAKGGELIKLIWDYQVNSADEALLALGPALQAMTPAADTARFSYHPAYDGRLQIGDAVIWAGMEFHEVADCLLRLTQACVDPNFRMADELPASEVPTVEMPAPLVADMADAVGLADDEERPPAVTNHEGYTRICREYTKATTLVWRTEHETADHLEVTCRIPGDRLREALGISLDELVKARRRSAAEQALDTALINLDPVQGFSEDVTVSESEDGKVCVSLQGRALVAADEEGGKILRALGELFQTRTIPW